MSSKSVSSSGEKAVGGGSERRPCSIKETKSDFASGHLWAAISTSSI